MEMVAAGTHVFYPDVEYYSIIFNYNFTTFLHRLFLNLYGTANCINPVPDVSIAMNKLSISVTFSVIILFVLFCDNS